MTNTTYSTRLAQPEDEAILWHFLYYAARMDEDGAKPEDAKSNDFLQKYVRDWGRDGDLGVIAYENDTDKAIGAVWLRIFQGAEKNNATEGIPELAIAVLPETIGKGVGTRLMQDILDHARTAYPAVLLNVRETNPAVRLYERLGFKIVGEIRNRVGTLSYDMRLDF